MILREHHASLENGPEESFLDKILTLLKRIVFYSLQKSQRYSPVCLPVQALHSLQIIFYE